MREITRCIYDYYYFLYDKISTCYRLKDEKQVAAIIDKVQEYLERQGTVSELCRVYLRKIEHLYYKFDSNVLKQKEVNLVKYLYARKNSSVLLNYHNYRM